MHTFRRCVRRYQGERYVKRFRCLDQHLSMAFAQLTYRESLRDIEACLRAHQSKLYHMGIGSRVVRSTLADANEQRDWHIYADFAQALIRIAGPLYAEEDLDSSSTTPFTHSMPPPSTCACQSFHGHCSALPNLRSNCIPCWIYVAISRRSFTSPMASCTTSTCSICCCRSPEPSTSWIGAT